MSYRHQTFSPHRVLEVVCRYCDVDIMDVVSKSRHKDFRAARAIFAGVSYALCQKSWPELCKVIYRKNHSSIIDFWNRWLMEYTVEERAEQIAYVARVIHPQWEPDPKKHPNIGGKLRDKFIKEMNL